MTGRSLVAPEVPVLLLVAEEPRKSAELRGAIESAGWRTATCRNTAQIEPRAADAPVSLVLFDLRESSAGAAQAVEALRSVGGLGATAPIVALLASEHDHNDPISSSVDGILLDPGSPGALTRAIDAWRPLSLEPTRRLASIFGARATAGMVERLARRLDAAMGGLRRGSFDPAEAHRLAGLCGTLGFAQAHAAWRDLSLGEPVLAEARRATRLTLAATARGL